MICFLIEKKVVWETMKSFNVALSSFFFRVTPPLLNALIHNLTLAQRIWISFKMLGLMNILDDALFMLISVSIATLNKYSRKQFVVNIFRFWGYPRQTNKCAIIYTEEHIKWGNLKQIQLFDYEINRSNIFKMCFFMFEI